MERPRFGADQRRGRHRDDLAQDKLGPGAGHRLLGAIPGDGHHHPGGKEDGHHIAHGVPGALRHGILDAGGIGGNTSEF